ncbi:MAG: leucine-rich repeat domain-containing protein [Treponema sp.]|jgi:hypothetical protein|nr:leucine-rich repeat domain-containing protein [Treponema sp.]
MKKPDLFSRRVLPLAAAALLGLSACSEEPPPVHEGYEAASLEELAALLAELPQNTAEDPWRIRLKDLNLGNLGGAEDGLEPLFRTFQGRYVSLDLDACTGATIGWGSSAAQSTANRPDKDKLISLILPAGAERVGYRNFENAGSLKSVGFPQFLRTIGNAAFAGCASLVRVDLPETLQHIEDRGFAGCVNLQTLIVRAQNPPGLGRGPYSPPLPVGADPGVFSGVPENFTIIVPLGQEDAYKTASGWSFYASCIRSEP